MFFATPRLRSNSPNRRFPANASRTISIDHVSPAASRDRATGQVSCSKLLRLIPFTCGPGAGGREIRDPVARRNHTDSIPGQSLTEREKVMSKKLEGKVAVVTGAS